MSPDVAASIKDRLLRTVRSRGEEFERTLARFAAERLLYRLGESPARSRCLLKGASLLSVWMDDPYRATRDIDISVFGASDDDAIRSLLEEICAVACPEDGVRYDLTGLRIETLRADEDYPGKRARFRAYLARARVAVQVDFAFGDALGVDAEEVTLPPSLEQLPAPRLRCYPREASVAEKFEAMVKLDVRNSRMKDFHDVWALSTSFAFDGPVLRRAITTCFDRRGTPWTEEMPRVMTPAFYEMAEIATRWRRYLSGGSVLVQPPAQFEIIGERIREFLGPVRDSVVSRDDFARRWAPGGPWL